MSMENEYIYSENFQAFGDKLKNNLSQYVSLETALLDGNAVAGEGESAPLNCVQEFLDAPLVGDKDSALKKLFAAGIALAKDSGVLPFDMPDSSPKAIASVVDNSLTQVKVAYKAAKGEIPAEEMVDTLVDHAAARTIAITNAVIDNVEATVDVISDALAVAFPPAALAIQLSKPILKYVLTLVAPKVKEAIPVGIEKASQMAKEAARPVLAKSRELRAKAKNYQLNAVYGQNRGL